MLENQSEQFRPIHFDMPFGFLQKLHTEIDQNRLNTAGTQHRAKCALQKMRHVYDCNLEDLSNSEWTATISCVLNPRGCHEHHSTRFSGPPWGLREPTFRRLLSEPAVEEGLNGVGIPLLNAEGLLHRSARVHQFDDGVSAALVTNAQLGQKAPWCLSSLTKACTWGYRPNFQLHTASSA